MNVMVFGPFAMNTPHFETELEIIQGHLDRGDEAIFLGCNSELLVCDANPRHDFKMCMECIGKRTAGLALLSPKIKAWSFLNLSSKDKKELNDLKVEFSDIDELSSYRIEQFEIGLAVLSSIMTNTRDPEPDLRQVSSLLKNMMYSTFAVYRSIQNHLDQLKIDKAYVFNGRLAIVRAAIRAFQSRNVEFCALERVYNIHHFGKYENSVPHDLVYIEQQIRKLWEQASGDPSREKIGAEFFVEQRGQVMHQGWNSFINTQEEGRLPETWDSSKINVAIFNSSEDERAAVGAEWKPPFYKSQLIGLQMIMRSLSAMPHNIHLYLRVHPNQKTVDNEWVRAMLSLNREFLTVIPPESPVSTYAILEQADKVLTFGSTTGIEAVYWGKPSILAGRSFYRNLGGTYNPCSHDELMALLFAELKPKAKEAALMYGYYKKMFGVPFRLFKATDVYEGKYKNIKVQPRPWVSMLIRKIESHGKLIRLTNGALRYRAQRKLGATAAQQSFLENLRLGTIR